MKQTNSFTATCKKIGIGFLIMHAYLPLMGNEIQQLPVPTNLKDEVVNNDTRIQAEAVTHAYHKFQLNQQYQRKQKGLKWKVFLTAALLGPLTMGVVLRYFWRRRKFRGEQNQGDGKDKSVFIIPLLITLLVIVTTVAAGGTGEGGFIWLLLLPALLLMWLLFLIVYSIKKRRAKALSK